MSRRIVAVVLAAAGAGGILAASATAPAPAQPLIVPAQQLQGTFQMAGTVRVAVNIPGEWVGQPVTRSWTFTPLCQTAPCATVELVRQRAAGTDTVVLHAIGPKAYTGSGQFTASLRCSGRFYSPGETVPFTITVRVRATQPEPAGPVPAATAITATYLNRSRVNLTPCIGVFGHDSAHYTGQLAAG